MKSQRVEPYETARRATQAVLRSSVLLDQNLTLLGERNALLAENRRIFGEVADLARQFADRVRTN